MRAWLCEATGRYEKFVKYAADNKRLVDMTVIWEVSRATVVVVRTREIVTVFMGEVRPRILNKQNV